MGALLIPWLMLFVLIFADVVPEIVNAVAALLLHETGSYAISP
jgi:hypothetical protein